MAPRKMVTWEEVWNDIVVRAKAPTWVFEQVWKQIQEDQAEIVCGGRGKWIAG